MSKIYGKIDDVNLSDVVNIEGFTSLWYINKRMIFECKLCEYRYMCIDCRAYRVSEDIYSRPLKCRYDMNQCKWNK